MENNSNSKNKIQRIASDPRLIRFLLILIICLTVLLSALIVIAGVQARKERLMAQQMVSAIGDKQEAGEERSLELHAYVEENRLYATLRDGDNSVSLPLTLRVRYPNGEVYYFDVQEEPLVLPQLQPGEYCVDLPAAAGYLSAGPIYCSVSDPTGIEGAANGDAVLDDQGNPRYRYRFLLGPNGRLLSTKTHRESDSLPLDCDGDGVPDYALELVRVMGGNGEEAALEQLAAFWRKVPLIRQDNHPISDYAVEISPIVAPEGELGGWRMLDGKMYYLDRNGQPVTGLRRLEGKLYYFEPSGARVPALGIDASYYNEHIDWEMVKSQGIDFAIVRIGGRGWGSGALYGDLRSDEYLLGARKAGIQLGVYFYSMAVNVREAIEEARAAIQSLKGFRLDLPIFIDVEFSGNYPRGRADRLTAAQRTEIIRAFCETVGFAGYAPGIYSGQYFYERNLHYPSLADYRIWMANYTAYGELPDSALHYDIWQFSDRSTVPGVPGRADLNVMFR